MANLCNNTMYIFAENSAGAANLKKVYKIIKQGEELDNSVYRIASELRDDLTEAELDREIRQCGLNQECRGWLIDVEYNKATEANKKEYIRVDYESKWSPCLALWHVALKPYGLKQVTLAEEPGCEVYVNTDEKGIFFPEKYVVDLCVEGLNKLGNPNVEDDYYTEYYETKTQAVKDLSVFFGKKFKNFTELEAYFEELKKIKEANGLDQWYINFIKYARS